MDTLDALDRSFASTREAVARVGPGELTLPTPCSEWDVQAVLDHVITVLTVFEAIAAKRAPEPVGGHGAAIDDPLVAYDKAAATTLAAWGAPGALDGEGTLPIGLTVPTELAAGINFLDCLVHGWDLRRALGDETELDPQLAEHALEVATVVVTPELREAGAFAPEVPVAADASPTARLVGFLGRQP